MTSRLEVLKAELEQLEAQGRYDAPQYGWLAETVDQLEREEAAKPSPAPTTEPGQPGADLASRMQAMAANPGRYSDAEQRAAVEELNVQVRAANRAALGQAVEPEVEDVGELAAAMQLAAQTMNRGDLDPVQADALVGRFNQALPQGDPATYAVADLQAALAGEDQVLRFKAAAELEQRGLLGSDVADQMIGWLNKQVRAADQAGPLAGAEIPEHLRELAEGMLAQAERDAQRHEDPHDALIGRFNAAVRQAAEQARERDLAGVTAGAPTTEPTTGSTTEEE